MLDTQSRVLTKIFTRFVKKKRKKKIQSVGKSVWKQTFDF